MPWKDEKPMDQKISLISNWLSKEYSLSHLASAYGVSRKTIYKWILRYNNEGIEGLKDRSQKPHWHPRTTNECIVKQIIDKKIRYKRWGPKKIVAKLKEEQPEIEWPAASTAGEWLKKNNLVKLRKKRQRVPPYGEPFIECDGVNDVWSADYKGDFRTGDHKKCYPITISDNYSRYLLACTGLLGPRYIETKRVFEETFKKNGLPRAIRIDNGTPFAGKSKTGLSRLSIWWIKLGVIPERIEKGKPQQNGRHERMHRTLKEYAINPEGKDLRLQQKQFDEFIYEYNEERPHESLGQKPPGSIYKRSKREYTDKPHKIEYDLGYDVRSVKHSGEIRFKGDMYLITGLLAGEKIGMKQYDYGKWKIYFSFQEICELDLLSKKIKPLNKQKKVLPMYPV
jgi:putative transposase